MAVTVTHSYPSFAGFTPSGVAAWENEHTVLGLATVAESGNYANLTGTPSIPTIADAWPVGSVFITTSTTNPATLLGFGTWSFIGEGQVLVGLATGIAAFNTVKASGGSLVATSSGTISTPTFTGDAYTPSGTNAIGLFREAVAGTNAASQVTGSVSVEFPTGVPTFAGVTASASASVNWPTATPTGTWTSHSHELPFFSTGATGISFLATSVFGVGAQQIGGAGIRVTASATGPLVRTAAASTGVVHLSNTATATATINWPASVPRALVTGLVPEGIISWPATSPSAVAKTLTAAAQIFTGVTGSVSGQVFTGVAKAPTGTISKPTYVGDPTTIVQPFVVVCMWERTA